MKVIDVLNKLAKGEEVPERIVVNGEIFQYSESGLYKNENGLLGERVVLDMVLNDEVYIKYSFSENPEEVYKELSKEISQILNDNCTSILEAFNRALH